MIATLRVSLIAAIPIAIAAGFISSSPVRVAVAARLSRVPWGATGSVHGRTGRGRAVLGSIAFIIGFAIVFISVGAIFGDWTRSEIARRILSIVFGRDHTLRTVLWRLVAGPLAQPRTSHPSTSPRASILGAGILGFLFGFGGFRASCPTLGAIRDSRRRHRARPPLRRTDTSALF